MTTGAEPPEFPPHLAKMTEELVQRGKEYRARQIDEDVAGQLHNDAKWVWPKGDAVLFVVEWGRPDVVWEDDEIKLDDAGKAVMTTRLQYNGYVRFSEPPLRPTENTLDGIATYVPVHGGITLALPSPDGSMTYGFDTAHACDDERGPPGYIDEWGPKHLSDIKNPEWLGMQCHLMHDAILLFAEVEDAYERADVEGRAEIIEGVWQQLSSRFERSMQRYHLGVNMRLLLGDV